MKKVPVLILSLLWVHVGLCPLTALASHPSWQRPDNQGRYYANLVQDPRPWFEKVYLPQIERILESGIIDDMQEVRGFQKTNGVTPGGSQGGLILFFREGIKGIWKPDDETADAEVSAYRAVSALHGQFFVPPTVFRDIATDLNRFRKKLGLAAKNLPGTRGSLQYFIPTTIDLQNSTVRKTVWPKVSALDKADWDIYRFVYGYDDFGWDNVIADNSHHLGWIDNAEICQRLEIRYGERPFVVFRNFKKNARHSDWPADFPFDDWDQLTRPTARELADFLGNNVDRDSVLRSWPFRKKGRDTTMQIIQWDNRVWMRSIGWGNYPPIKIQGIRAATIRSYKALTRDSLRKALTGICATEEHVSQILRNRDRIINATAGHTVP